MKRSVKSLAKAVVERSLSILPRRTARDARLVLAYHNVVPDSLAVVGDRSLHLAQSRFEQQLKLVKSEAEIVSLADLLAAPLRGRYVAITFDDAYASALSLGVSHCTALAAPCTVFVAPALLGTIPTWDRLAAQNQWSDGDRERYLRQPHAPDAEATGASDDQTMMASLAGYAIADEPALTRACESTLVSLGNHTWSHPNLSALTESDAVAQIRRTSEWLRARYASRNVPYIAYPFGLEPPNASSVLTATAMQGGMLVTGGWFSLRPSHTAWQIPRWNVPAGLSVDGFAARLRGWR